MMMDDSQAKYFRESAAVKLFLDKAARDARAKARLKRQIAEENKAALRSALDTSIYDEWMNCDMIDSVVKGGL